MLRGYDGLRWPTLLLAGAATFAAFVEVQPAIAVDPNRLTVDGLPLGGKVRTDSGIYKQYDCTSSSQYRELTYCKRVKTDFKNGSKLTTTTSIIHSRDGTVAYVNQFVEPATFTRAEIDVEIARLSTKFGEEARLLEAPVQPGLPKAVIATWGTVKLVKLADADLAVLRNDKSPEKGILVDFLGDYTRSARAGFPVFGMQGDFGYIWIANYDDQARGTLRFLAVNAAALTAAFGATETAQSRQSNSEGVVATAKQQPAAQPAGPTLERQLEECGESCPDKPELDKLRRDTIEQLEQARSDAEDADRFSAAMGSVQTLSSYIDSCDAKKCAFLSQAKAARDALVSSQLNGQQAGAEERQYRSARGDAKALKQYVAQCDVCAFAQDAVAEINEIQTKGASELFDLVVCNNEYLPVDVAFAGRPDPNSDMWIAKGWYTFVPGECSKIATLRKGNYYVTAHNKRGTWEGDKTYCASNKAFERVLLPEGGDCLEDEEARGFRKRNYEDSGSKDTWTIGPVPWSYTALAFSFASNSWGWSGAQPTLDQAKQVAIDICSKSSADCRVVNWARDDKCLALVRSTNSDGDSFCWATGDDRINADLAARNECNKRSGRYGRPIKQSCSR